MIIGIKKSTIVAFMVAILIIIGGTVFTLLPQSFNANNSTPDEVSTYDEVTVIQETTELHITTTAELTTVVPTTEAITTEPIYEVEPTKEPEIETLQSVTEVTEPKQEEIAIINAYSDNELELVARTTYCESGGCSEYCQWLTASTILNLADQNGGIENVCTNSNMFNVAGIIWNKTPSNLSYSVAQRVLSGDRDYNVMAFREGYYHSFGTPYTNVDNVYFSTY